MARVPVAFIYQSYRLLFYFIIAIPTWWLSLTHVCTQCGLGIDFQRGLVTLVDAVAGQRVSLCVFAHFPRAFSWKTWSS
ncbi:hypothetical protein B0H14DRAFT_2958779 [Mycena olivaceomarginata]|nr:hypothetical protein B0H14DRAFT_2958779 [Mycena olivaceomarginata]